MMRENREYIGRNKNERIDYFLFAFESEFEFNM